MKVMIISFLVACIVAMVLAQTAMDGGASTGSGSSSMDMGGNMRQMLLMAALGGSDNARVMLQCQMFNLPMIYCMQRMR